MPGLTAEEIGIAPQTRGLTAEQIGIASPKPRGLTAQEIGIAPTPSASRRELFHALPVHGVEAGTPAPPQIHRSNADPAELAVQATHHIADVESHVGPLAPEHKAGIIRSFVNRAQGVQPAFDTSMEQHQQNVADSNSALQNFSAGAYRGTVKWGGKAIAGIGGIPGLNQYGAAVGADAAESAQNVPAKEGFATTAGEFTAPALLTAPTFMVGGGAMRAGRVVPELLGAQGAIEGVGGAQLAAEEARRQGQPIPAGEQVKRGLGEAIVGYGGGKLTGEALGGIGELKGVPTRVAAAAGAQAGIGGAQQAGSNIVNERPVGEGVPEAIEGGAITGAIYQGVGEVHRGLTAEQIGVKPTEQKPRGKTAAEIGVEPAPAESSTRLAPDTSSAEAGPSAEAPSPPRPPTAQDTNTLSSAVASEPVAPSLESNASPNEPSGGNLATGTRGTQGEGKNLSAGQELRRPGGDYSNALQRPRPKLFMAAKLDDGQVVYDQSAASHADLLDKIGRSENPELGFALEDGRFLTREGAAKLVSARGMSGMGKLHSTSLETVPEGGWQPPPTEAEMQQALEASGFVAKGKQSPAPKSPPTQEPSEPVPVVAGKSGEGAKPPEALTPTELKPQTPRTAVPLRNVAEGSMKILSSAQESPVIYRDTRGTGERFHGTSSPIDKLQEGHYADQNIYGQGLYTTDDLTTASKYTKKGKGGAPTVYRVKENRPSKMLDLEQQAPPDVAAIFQKMGERSWDSLGQYGKEIFEEAPNAPLKRWFDEVRASSRAEGYSTDTVQELFNSVSDDLRNLGYEGLQHTGGNLAGKGKRTHEVRIYFDPEKSVSVEQVNPSDYAQEQAKPPPTQETSEPVSMQERASGKANAPRKFFKSDIEKELLDRHEAATGGERDAMAHEIGAQGIGPFTFHKELPEEVTTFLEGHPDAERLRNRVFRVTDRPGEAGGEDAMSNLGNRYFQIAEQMAGKGIEQAVAHAEKSQDPRGQMLAAIHRNLPPTGERVDYQQRDPNAMATGSKFRLQGHEFEIVEDADGYRVLKDGDDYPVLPADQVGKLPIDKGSIQTGTEPTVPEGDFAPSTSEPPKTGKLDQLEQWATQRLAARDAAEKEALSKATPEQRRRKGSAGPLDPERVLLKTIQLAARLAKGGVDRTLWVKEQIREFGDAVRQHVGIMWMNARRLKAMDEPSRANWISQRTAPKRMAAEQPESVAAAIAKLDRPEQFGQQLEDLRTRMLSARGGIQRVEGIKKEIADLAAAHLPPDQRGKLLNLVASAQTMRDLVRGTQRISNVLAQHDIRRALTDMQDLIGKQQLKVFKPMTTAQRQGTASAKVPGDVNPATLRDIDLKKLSPGARDDIKDLMVRARYLKKLLSGAGAMGGKPIEQQARVDALTKFTKEFRDIEQQIRVAAANDLASREIEIAGKLQKLEDVKNQTVAAIKAPPETATPTGEPPKERNRLRSAWRAQENVDAMIGGLVGETHPAFEASIRDVRQGQSDVFQEQRNFEDVLSAKLKDAGIAPHTAAYDRWLQNRETVTLPDAGKVKMSRAEMLDLYGHLGDSQTKQAIANGAKWTFEHNRNAAPLTLTEADVKAVVSQLRPQEKAIVDSFKDYKQKNLTERATRAKLAIDQRAPEPIKGHWPRARNRPPEGTPQDWKQIQRRWLENISSQEERGQDRHSPFLIRDAIEVMHDFVNDNANLIHMAERLHNVSAILENRDVQGAIERKHGPATNRQIKQFLLDTAWGNQRVPRTRLERVWAAVARNVSRAWLTLNPSPMAKNGVLGTIALAPEFSEADLAHGVNEARKPGTYRRMLDTSPVAWNRYEGGGLYGQYSPLLERRILPEAQLSFREALKRGKLGQAIDAIPAMKRADAVPFTVAFAAAENYVSRTRPKLTGDARTRAILEKFHEATYRTQNGNSSTEISYMASRMRQNGPVLQALLMFQSDANKKLNQFARWGHMDGAQRAKLVVASVASAAGAAAISYGLKRGASNLVAAITGKPTDKKQLEKDRRNAVWDAIGNLTGISYFGNWATDAVRSATTSGDAGLNSPVGETLDRVFKGMAQAVQAITADKAKSKRAMSTKEKIMGILARTHEPLREMLGDPTVPAGKLIQRGYQAATFDARAARLHEENVRAADAQRRHVPFMHTPEWQMDQDQKSMRRALHP